jgi:hypothetical protein
MSHPSGLRTHPESEAAPSFPSDILPIQQHSELEAQQVVNIPMKAHHAQ